MKYTYSSIKLEGAGFESYTDAPTKERINSIDGLSRVNIFVGSNNSGKSRFLRELLKTEEFSFHSNNPDTKKFLSYVKDISGCLFDIKNSEYSKGILDFTIDKNGSFDNNSFRVIELDYYNLNENFNDLKRLLIAIKNSVDITHVSKSQGNYRLEMFTRDLRFFLQEEINAKKIDFILNFVVGKTLFKRFYIPILRSLNNFDVAIDGSVAKDRSSIRDFFRNRTQQVYGIADSINIFTGQSLYFDVRDMLLGDHEQRQRIADYEKFLSGELFGGQSISLIPKVGSDVLSIKIGKEEKEIYNLGDGIQSLIILTFQLFMVDEGLFFIEEPEINLHPGMQRKFLEVILNNKGSLAKKNHQYFFTTHSNHFLDLTLDYNNISIYKFSSNNSSDDIVKFVEQVSSGDERVLKELGVKNSSVFLANATIWVEGITDRLYIKKFLELYQEHHKKKEIIFEDVDYSFVEYGGNNITHWSFLDSLHPTICIERLCGKSILIADHDGKNKIDRHIELKRKLGRRFIKLSCREIENILSIQTIGEVIKQYPADSDFVTPKIRDRYPHKNEPIGTFIKNRLKPKNDYKGQSGSLKSSKKLDFCIKATESLRYEEMTTLARALSKTIYDFIINQKS